MKLGRADETQVYAVHFKGHPDQLDDAHQQKTVKSLLLRLGRRACGSNTQANDKPIILDFSS
jgi:hypothetical protein